MRTKYIKMKRILTLAFALLVYTGFSQSEEKEEKTADEIKTELKQMQQSMVAWQQKMTEKLKAVRDTTLTPEQREKYRKEAAKHAEAMAAYSEEWAEDMASWAEENAPKFEAWAKENGPKIEEWAKEMSTSMEEWAKGFAEDMEAWAQDTDKQNVPTPPVPPAPPATEDEN